MGPRTRTLAHPCRFSGWRDERDACGTSGRTKHALEGRPVGFDLFTHPRTGWVTHFDQTALQGDVLHLHWVANFIDYPSFFSSIPEGHPVVWTLHDMNPFTGGCHYTSGCEAFCSTCQHCPQLGRRGPNDLSRRAFHTKSLAFRDKNLHIVADSYWLQSQAQRSSLFSHARSFRTIHYGLKVETLAPQSQSAARREFGIPEDRIVIGFGAASVHDRRKGLRELLQALSQLRTQSKVVALVFGGGSLSAEDGDVQEFINVGYVEDLNRQARVFSAMDLFVMPSLEEAFGLTGLEAMACGVPVVAFAAGGITDYVRPEETGLLAKVGDAAELARQMQWMIDHPDERRGMGARARQMVVGEFTFARQAQKYLDLYDSLLSRRARSAA